MGSDMSMSSMSMTFFSAQDTPLFSTQWTPMSSGAYAGTCIFLIILSFILRALFAFKHYLELRWVKQAFARRYIYVADKTPVAEQVAQDADSKEGVLTVNGVDQSVKLMEARKHIAHVHPWRFSTDLPRAALVTVIAGVGYLLMLAVMTYNVGYFLSVLGGVFIGELAFGRFYTHESRDHDH